MRLSLGVTTDENELDDMLDVQMTDLSLSSDFLASNDPQEVAQYLNDIMEHFRRTQARAPRSFFLLCSWSQCKRQAKLMPQPNYMARQKEINSKMREILVDWLHEVHRRFKLSLPTFYLTINIIDRFLEKKVVRPVSPSPLLLGWLSFSAEC